MDAIPFWGNRFNAKTGDLKFSRTLENSGFSRKTQLTFSDHDAFCDWGYMSLVNLPIKIRAFLLA